MFEYFQNLSDIENTYLWVALVSTGLFIIQSVFSFLDIGDYYEMDSSIDGDFDIGDGFQMPFHLFTVRGVIGFLMLFGWSGLMFSKSEVGIELTLVLAFLCGIAMMVIISLIYYFVSKLGQSGNVDLRQSLGKECEVYIPIPEEKSGTGKVTIILGGSLKEIGAITYHETLKSGDVVKVVDVINDKLVVEKIIK